MDWFFEQSCVRRECRPTNGVHRAARPKGFSRASTLIRKMFLTILSQRSNLPSRRKAQSQCFWATVSRRGEETSFQFVSAALPKRLLIDPQMTLLCVSPSSSHWPRNSAAYNRAFWRIRLVSLARPQAQALTAVSVSLRFP